MLKYRHTKDIDVDEERDIRPLNTLQTTAINRIKLALQDLPDSQGGFTHLLATLLQLFLTTNASIAILADKAQSKYRFAGDMVSLTREQVEKVFLITLLMNDPEKWLRVYLRSAWKSQYERYLLDKFEFGRLKRFSKEERKSMVRELEQGRHISKLHGVGFEVLISKRAQQAIAFKFKKPDEQLPKYLQMINLKRDFTFPTPGQVRDKFRKDQATYDYLNRWHWEYKHLCEFSHVMLGKLTVPSAVEQRDIFDQSKVEYIVRKQIADSLMTSAIAAACSCTEVVRLLPPDANILGALISFWEALRRDSLFAEIFWTLRAKDLFPPFLLGKK